MSKIGIAKLPLKKRSTKIGNINGTANEVVIINPTTIGNLPPTKFTTNGEPSPVEMADNKNTDSIKLELTGIMVTEIKFIIKYIPTGTTTSFAIVRMMRFFG